MLSLADNLALDRDDPKKLEESQKWYAQVREAYQKTVEAGDTEAMLGLAAIYQGGRGRPPDDVQAAGLCRCAADLGSPDAMLVLSLLYSDGVGVTADKQQCLAWLNKAAERGQTDAMHVLALAYRDGELVATDKHKQLEWCSRAAERKNPRAMCLLGQMCLDGIGVRKDESTAVSWFQAAATLGSGEALTRMGLLTAAGQAGLKQNDSAAVVYFQVLPDKAIRGGRIISAGPMPRGGVEKPTAAGRQHLPQVGAGTDPAGASRPGGSDGLLLEQLQAQAFWIRWRADAARHGTPATPPACHHSGGVWAWMNSKLPSWSRRLRLPSPGLRDRHRRDPHRNETHLSARHDRGRFRLRANWEYCAH